MTDNTTPPRQLGPNEKRPHDATIFELLDTEDRIKGFIVEEVNKGIEAATKTIIADIIKAFPKTNQNDEQLARIESALTSIRSAQETKLTITVNGTTPTPTVDEPVVTTPTVFKATPQPTDGFLYGVNVSGGEMQAVPPRDDAKYPTTTVMDFLYDRGFNCIRVPFKWHRVQATLNGPLETWHINQLLAVVKYAVAKGNMTVILDCHNYAERDKVYSATIKSSTNGNVNALLGSPELPAATYVDFWRKFAPLFKDYPNVHFCLSNEPKCSKLVWRPLVDDLILAIRNTGAKNKVHINGTSWSGAHSWVSSGNAAAFDDFTDPANNFVYDVHQYCDVDFSGTHATCRSGVANLLGPLMAWSRLKPAQRKFFLGEFAAGDGTVEANKQCGVELPALVQLVQNNRDVFIGYAAWAAGAISTNYPFRIELTNGKETWFTNTLRSLMPHHIADTK